MNTRENPKCILIADDLTGACDTGAQFARRGLSCEVQLFVEGVMPQVDVLALNTDSRRDTIEESRDKLQRIADRLPAVKTSLVLKKIDSTLRGNVAHEVNVAMRLIAADCVLLAPAFPAMHRVVRNGVLEWSDCAGPGRAKIAELLTSQGVGEKEIATVVMHNQDPACLAQVINSLIERGAKWIVPDCDSQDHLRNLVAAAYDAKRRILWVGSAGLGSALAEYLASGPAHHEPPPWTEGPALFCIGSTNSVTSLQKAQLVRVGQALEFEAQPQSLDAVKGALQQNRHVVLTLEGGMTSEGFIQELTGSLNEFHLAGIFLTGGDTGMLVSRILGADTISLRGEVAVGIPWGIFHGGKFHGLPVITKSGGFGDEDALLRCAEFLSPSKKVLQ